MILGSLVSQDLIRLTMFMNAIFQQLDGVFTCRVVVDLAAWNISAVIVQVAYHPFICLGHFEV